MINSRENGEDSMPNVHELFLLSLVSMIGIAVFLIAVYSLCMWKIIALAMLSFDFIAEDEKISKEKESLFEKNELKEESSVVSQCDLSLTLKTNIHNLSLRNIEN